MRPRSFCCAGGKDILQDAHHYHGAGHDDEKHSAEWFPILGAGDKDERQKTEGRPWSGRMEPAIPPTAARRPRIIIAVIKAIPLLCSFVAITFTIIQIFAVLVYFKLKYKEDQGQVME